MTDKTVSHAIERGIYFLFANRRFCGNEPRGRQPLDCGYGQQPVRSLRAPETVQCHPSSEGRGHGRSETGLLGNTGNTSGPHLHFQVMDRPSALKTNGLPFVFDCFVLSSTVMGSIDGTRNNFSAGTPLPLQPIGTFERDRLRLALDIIDIS